MHFTKGVMDYFEVVTFEYDDQKNVTIADAHDAVKADLQIFSSTNSLLSLKAIEIKKSSQINKILLLRKQFNMRCSLPNGRSGRKQ